MRRHSRWLSELDPDTYLHITRYFPRYRYTIPATDTGLMRRLKDIAEESLHNVFLGNVWYRILGSFFYLTSSAAPTSPASSSYFAGTIRISSAVIYSIAFFFTTSIYHG